MEFLDWANSLIIYDHILKVLNKIDNSATIALYYSGIRDADIQKIPGWICKVNGPSWIIHKNRLYDPRDVKVTIVLP